MLTLTWYLTGSHYEAVGTGVLSVMVGITYTLITVRVGLGWGQESQDVTVSWRRARASRSLDVEHGPSSREDHRRPQTVTLTATHPDEREQGVDVKEAPAGVIVGLDEKRGSSQDVEDRMR